MNKTLLIVISICCYAIVNTFAAPYVVENYHGSKDGTLSGWKIQGNNQTGRQISASEDKKLGKVMNVKFGSTTPWKWAGIGRGVPGSKIKELGADSIMFWFKGDGSENGVGFGCSESTKESWGTKVPLKNTEWHLVKINLKAGEGGSFLKTGGWKKKNGIFEPEKLIWFGFNMENGPAVNFSVGPIYLCGKAKTSCVDISTACNMVFVDDRENDGTGGWTDQGPGNSLRGITPGNKILNGIPFSFLDPTKGKSCIVLKGKEKANFPLSAKVEINNKASTIFVLHAAAWASGKAADYTLIYDDGSEYTFPIVCGRDIADWWKCQDGKNMLKAWENSEGRGLVMTPLNNPRPDKVIKAIRFKTGYKPVVGIVAITLSDTPYVFPQKEALDSSQKDWFPTRPRRKIVKGSACDFSFLLEAPAGQYGFAKAKDDHYVFENGKKISFFGVNACSFVRPKDEIDRIIDLLSKMGVNIVRLHHMDPVWNTPSINNPYVEKWELWDWAMERVDYFIAEAKKRGIYTYIDLSDHHPFRRDDGKNLSKKKNGAATELFYVPEMINKFKGRMKQWLQRKNVYTGLRYCDDPAIAFVELTNENCMTNMIRLGAKPKNTYYIKVLKTLWHEFLKQRYHNHANLRKAWTDGKGNCALKTGEALDKNNIELMSFIGNKAPWNSPFQVETAPARISDINRFLIWVEERWQKMMRKYYQELGGKAILVGNNWPGGFDFRAKTHVDSMGQHTYWNHPPEAFRPAVNYLEQAVAKFTQSQLKDKPLFVGEINYCYANPYRAEGLIFTGAYGAFQGIGGFTWFTGPTDSSPVEHPGSFDMTNDPVHLTQFPVGAFLFHKAVTEGQKKLDICYTENDDFASYMESPEKSIWNVVPYMIRSRRCLIENDKYDGDVDLVIPSGRTSGGDYSNAKRVIRIVDCPYLDSKAGGKVELDEIKSDQHCVKKYKSFKTPIKDIPEFIAKKLTSWNLGQQKDGYLISSTKELAMNCKQGIFTIDTKKAKGITGFIKGKQMKLNGLEFKSESRFASVTVLAIDEKTIDSSKRLLLTCIARCEPKEWCWSPAMNNKPKKKGVMPMMVEPVKGVIKIKHKTPGELNIFTLSPEGYRLKKLEPTRTRDGLELKLTGTEQATQFEICNNDVIPEERLAQLNITAGNNAETNQRQFEKELNTPDSSVLVAFEGEEALTHNFNNGHNAKHNSLSGKRWLSHKQTLEKGKNQATQANFKFNIPETGEYSLWVREFWVQLASNVAFQIDDGPWQIADRRPIIRDVAPRINNWIWVDVDRWGKMTLKKGEHTLNVRIEAPSNYNRKYQAAFDLFMFIKGNFLPKNYKLK